MTISDKIKEHEELIEGLRSNHYPLTEEIESKIDYHRMIITKLKSLKYEGTI